MQDKYDHKDIEQKWQEKWREGEIYKTEEDKNKPKSFILDMFPYPSGEGLHVGHPKGYIATDVYSRMKKMQGHSVLHPMGWDAFGLPAENFAIKNKIHPRVSVEKNIKRFKEQLEKIGFNYDWEREVNTTDPEYYKWTQWIFLKLLEKGLAYESYEPINWCPSCQTGLANEDLEADGTCERCGSVVEKRPMRQWILKITDYADRLLDDLKYLDKWPEHIKESQRNWIGRSEGAIIKFEIQSTKSEIEIFTTRADTLVGATYLVLAPEHLEIENLKLKIENWSEVENYINEVKSKTEIDRADAKKEKTGVEIRGIRATNPATGEEIPIWIADYVLGNYATGAIMAVPSHDERDQEFAEKYKLKIKEITPDWSLLEKFGKKMTKYKLRDWVFSRQRYWGEPIPVVHCEGCGTVPVAEKDLPVLLPEVEHYEPTGTGESPLANITEWVNTTCPKCGSPGKRETNTMPQWAGSSWYYLRFADPKNDKEFANQKKLDYWMGEGEKSGVDVYVGGAEHATRHLIYARFWHKFLYDLGYVKTIEPFMELHSVGLVMAEDGRKMSKRFGNVINPDDVVNIYGADSLRMYEMFMGPFENTIAWKTDNLVGVRRFLEKVWKLSLKLEKRKSQDEGLSNLETFKLETLLHKTIKKVTEDILAFKFNTAISSMMIFVNQLESEKAQVEKENFETFLKLLAPFAPHMTEEIWSNLGNKNSIHLEEWPKWDEDKIKDERVVIVVQVNSRVRAQFEADAGISEDEAKEKALAMPEISKWLESKEIKKVIFIPDKLINFVVD